MKRVLILLHFAAKREGQELIAAGRKAWPVAQANLDQCTAVFSSDIAFGFVGVSNKECSELHRTLNKAIGLHHGDNLSVLELSENIISTHPGLMEWQGATVMVSALAGLARQR